MVGLVSRTWIVFVDLLFGYTESRVGHYNGFDGVRVLWEYVGLSGVGEF